MGTDLTMDALSFRVSNNSINSTLSWSKTFNRSRLKAEKARRRLDEFVRQAWPLLEPHTSFVDGMHLQAVCDHLQAVSEGRIRNLIINVPPGHAKSLLTAVFWPAWVWIDHPESRWLFSSYREPLATRDSLKAAAWSSATGTSSAGVTVISSPAIRTRSSGLKMIEL